MPARQEQSWALCSAKWRASCLFRKQCEKEVLWIVLCCLYFMLILLSWERLSGMRNKSHTHYWGTVEAFRVWGELEVVGMSLFCWHHRFLSLWCEHPGSNQPLLHAPLFYDVHDDFRRPSGPDWSSPGRINMSSFQADALGYLVTETQSLTNIEKRGERLPTIWWLSPEVS